VVKISVRWAASGHRRRVYGDAASTIPGPYLPQSLALATCRTNMRETRSAGGSASSERKRG
jgi:hypothetical protein